MSEEQSFKITLEVSIPASRLDQFLIEALRNQNDNLTLKVISRSQFKNLFKEKRIRIKGQNAKPASGLAVGKTDIEILGF